MQNPQLLRVFAETNLETTDKSFSYVSLPVDSWSKVIMMLPVSEFVSITQDREFEITVIVETEVWEKLDKKDLEFSVSNDWRLFSFHGEGLMEIVGYLSKISLLLAQNNISIMPFSSFHKFHLMVKEADYLKAQAILKIFLSSQ